MGVVDSLRRAREAYERRDWVAAYERLTELDGQELGADDFARLGAAAYLTGRTNDCVQALQRAYQAHADRDEALAAARCAFWLALALLMSRETAVASGWTARARRLLDDVPGDVVERGYVAVLLMFRCIGAGDYAGAHVHAQAVTACGRRFNAPDLIAMGLASEGRFVLQLGRVPEGVAMMDEAMLSIASGDVAPIFAGSIYCSMVEACQEISDFGRAAEWTVALTQWCDDQPGLVPFTGQCAVHRGQLMRIRGAYDEALSEYAFAVERYVRTGTAFAAGLAMAERGDVLRLLGRFDDAADAYAQAHGYGYEPQPGLAQLWLARGRTAAALGAVTRLLAECREPVRRAQILPAAVDILIGAGCSDRAPPLCVELDGIAAGFGCAALRAMADYANGAVAVETGAHAEAIEKVRRACRVWTGLDAPYEAARCRVLIGRALRGLGDEESAAAEIAAAHRAFAQLGAAPAARAAAVLLRPAAPGGLTAREVEVLRLVAAGRSNPEIAAALVLSEKTVARHLSNIFGKIDVTSRTAAAAFAFEHRL